MKLSRWAVVFLYVLLIFATMPYVPKIWNSLTQLLGKSTSTVLNIGFSFLGFYLVLFSYLKLQKKSLIFYTVLGAIFLCYGYLLKNLNVTIEKIHLLEYGLLSFLVYWAIKPKREGILIYGVILGIVFIISWTDELIQRITPGRVYEFKDVLLNWKSGILGTFLVLILRSEK